MAASRLLFFSCAYLDLSLGQDTVQQLSVLLLSALAAALLVAEQPQGLRALQFDLKLLAVRQEIWVTLRVSALTLGSDRTSRLTSFQMGSVESLCTRVLALLTKYPKESTSREQ